MKCMIYLISFFVALATYSATLGTPEELLERRFSFPLKQQIESSLTNTQRFKLFDPDFLKPLAGALAAELAEKNIPVRSLINITKQALTSIRKKGASLEESLGYLPWILQISLEKPSQNEALEIFWGIHQNGEKLKEALSPSRKIDGTTFPRLEE
jgi:hypothetical protein